MDLTGHSRVAAVLPQLWDKSGENMRDGQRKDAEIKMVIDFPDDDKKAREQGTIPSGE